MSFRRSPTPLRLAVTFTARQVLRAEFTKGMEPDDVAAVLRKLANRIDDLK